MTQAKIFFISSLIATKACVNNRISVAFVGKKNLSIKSNIQGILIIHDNIFKQNF